MALNSIVLEKKLARNAANVCTDCGKNPCLCKIPKSVARRANDYAGLPVGTTRRGGQRTKG